MLKRLIAIIICISLYFANMQTYAATSSTTNAQQNLDNTNNKINDLENNQESVENEISTNESELENIMNSISELEVDIEIKGDKIGQIEEALRVAQAEQESQYEAMKLRIQYMYENSESFSYVNMFLESDNLSETLNRIEYISNVYTYDRNLLTRYKHTTKTVSDNKTQLQNELTDLESMQCSYSSQKESLEATLATLQAESENYEEQISQAKAAAAKYQAQIIASKSTKPDNLSSNNSSSTSSNTYSGNNSSLIGINPSYTTGISSDQVILYAKQFLGNPYVYGGTDINNGIDCSAYVQYVFAHFGITLPRTSYEDRSVGSQVSLDCIAPGDIVCFEGHVAIYIGNNQIIHARGSAYGIVITTLNYRSDIITVRRVL